MVSPLVNTRHELGCCCGALLQGVEDIYANALNRLQRSALLHIFIAQYMQVYRANHHIESLHLTAAEVWFLVLRIVLGGCMSRSFISYYLRSKSSMIHVPTCVFMRSKAGFAARVSLQLACTPRPARVRRLRLRQSFLRMLFMEKPCDTIGAVSAGKCFLYGIEDTCA